jgi:hypothetical protein
MILRSTTQHDFWVASYKYAIKQYMRHMQYTPDLFVANFDAFHDAAVSYANYALEVLARGSKN